MSEPFGGRSEAGIGFAATASALLIALTVFPADPSPRGALTIPAMILSAGILLVPIYERSGAPRTCWAPRILSPSATFSGCCSI